MALKIFAVVVTYNRYNLLKENLRSLLGQAIKIDTIIVVDNASTDGTLRKLSEDGWTGHPSIQVLALPDNTGGAGGFAAGMRHALELGADWLWMMDDDAVPHRSALEKLLAVAVEKTSVYGSLAVNGDDTSWATTLVSQERKVVNKKCDVPVLAEVQSLPFLGFFINKDLVSEIGFPDEGYFIAADDVEYCMRAQHAGHGVYIAGNSLIEHPKSQRYSFGLFGVKLICLTLPPWKRYYDTRNRLLIGKKYYGWRYYFKTIPGSFLRLLAALLNEPHRAAQAKAFFAGLLDGVRGVKGRRHERWSIRQ